MDLTPATLAALKAIHRYDWNAGLTANGTPSDHHQGEAFVAVEAAAPLIRSQVIAEYAEHLKDGIDDARNSGERHLYEDALTMLEAWGEE